jgi:hypothetical protein
MKGIIITLALACTAAALPQLPAPQPTTGPLQAPAKGVRPPPNIAQWLGKMGIDPAKATPVPGGYVLASPFVEPES